MKKRSKIILVLFFAIVFAFSLCINIFADSAGSSGAELKPLFAPAFVKASTADEAVLFAGFSNVDVNLTSGEDVVTGTTSLEDTDLNSRGHRNFFLEFPWHESGRYVMSFTDRYEYYDEWSMFQLIFNDFFYAGSGSSIDLSRYYNILSIDFNNNYSVSTYGLDCDITYIDSSGTLDVDSNSYYGPDIRSVLMNLEQDLVNRYPDGALVQNVYVYPQSSSGRFTIMEISGSIIYVDDGISLGANAALDTWSEYFGEDVVVESPTIIESVTRGLNSIWNTSLFGTFTIGQVFSACAGFALFGWILKIFNR